MQTLKEFKRKARLTGLLLSGLGLMAVSPAFLVVMPVVLLHAHQHSLKLAARKCMKKRVTNWPQNLNV